MGEVLAVFGDHDVGDGLWAHRVSGIGALAGLGREVLTHSGVRDGNRSTERIGTAIQPIHHAETVYFDGRKIYRTPGAIPIGIAVATPAPEQPAEGLPPPRDHLIAAALARETAAIGRDYVPDRHTDFDVEHGWQVTLEMGRGG